MRASTGFDVQRTLQRALTHASTCTQVREAMRTTVFDAVQHVLTGADLDHYGDGQWHAGATLGSYLVAGGAELRVGQLAVVLQQRSPIRVTPSWAECPGEDCASTMFIASGPRPIAKPVVFDAPVARALIASEMVVFPDMIAGPIDGAADLKYWRPLD